MENINLYKAIALIFTLALAIFVILKFQMFDLELWVKLTETNIRSDAIRWRISISTKVIASNFIPALIVSEILMFKGVDLQNLGKGHGEQHARWRHSMANTKVCKVTIRFLRQLSPFTRN